MSDDDRPGTTRKQLEAWVLSTLPRALGYATSLLRDRSLADDVVHDCYVRLLQKADRYDLLRDGTKLLYRAITNACIDHNQRRRVVLSLSRADELSEPMEAAVEARRAGPLEDVLRKELERAIEEELARLPLTQQAALELASLGYSLQEIAEAIRTSASNAGVLVHRARKTLAQRLSSYLGPNTDDRARESR